MKEINFLESQRRRLQQQAAKDRKLSLISFGVLGLILATFIGFFIYNYYLTTQISQVETQKSQLESTLAAALNKQKDLMLFSKKLFQIEDIIAERKQGLTKLNFLDNNLSDKNTITVRTFRYNIKESTIKTNIETQNVFSAGDIFTELNNPEFDEAFASIDYGGLNRSRSAIYTFSTVFNLE